MKYRDLFRKHNVPFGIENGDNSMLWAAPEVKNELPEAKVLKVCYCMMGTSFRKRTRLAVWGVRNEAVWKAEAEKCSHQYMCSSKNGLCARTGKPHLILRGWARGKALTAQGAEYPRKFANIIAKVLCS